MLGFHVKGLALSAGLPLAGLFLAASPAAGQHQSDVEPGEMLIIREVAPRNALIPGTGQPHTVDVSPQPNVFGPLETLGKQIDDQQAAAIAGQLVGPSGLGAALPKIEELTGLQTLATINGAAERGSAGGLGGMISDAITGALDGAFASIPGGGRP